MKGICGPETKDKQQDFKAILQHHLNICKKITEKEKYPLPYLYIDTFGGPGKYHEPEYKGLEGSPLIFQQSAKAIGINYSAFIYEIDPLNYMSLISNLQPDNNITVCPGNNLDLLKNLPIKDSWQLGLLYCDPPQDKDTFDLTFAMMELVSKQYKRLDLMLYVAATNIKRIGTIMRLKQQLAPINKKYWAIRELRGAHQWTFLIGTNWADWADWSKRGFYNINSPRGKEIFEKANYTKIELRDLYQPPLI